MHAASGSLHEERDVVGAWWQGHLNTKCFVLELSMPRNIARGEEIVLWAQQIQGHDSWIIL